FLQVPAIARRRVAGDQKQRMAPLDGLDQGARRIGKRRSVGHRGDAGGAGDLRMPYGHLDSGRLVSGGYIAAAVTGNETVYKEEVAVTDQTEHRADLVPGEHRGQNLVDRRCHVRAGIHRKSSDEPPLQHIEVVSPQKNKILSAILRLTHNSSNSLWSGPCCAVARVLTNPGLHPQYVIVTIALR